MKDNEKNGFFDAVYNAVKQIPRGKVASYGQVAIKIGKPRSARIVGYALHKNRYFGKVPCHRVVFADGSLTSAFCFGGKDAQREMLLREGIQFDNSGKVLRQHFLDEL